jgi:hypothetical protein
LVFLTLLYLSCDSRKDTPMYFAKVNDNYLSLDDLKVRFDSSSIRTKSKVRDFISQWVNQNLLYKEAEEMGITKTSEFNDLVAEAGKSIAINMLLEKEVYSKSIEVTPSEIFEYYSNHKDEFILGNDIVNISYVVFSNPVAAGEFKKNISANIWKNLLDQPKQNSFSGSIRSQEDSSFFKSSELSPPDLWKAACNMRPNDISEPMKSLDGYIVFKLNTSQKAGEIGDINYARAEIKERILIDKRKKLYSGFLYELQKKYHPEFLNESINK